MEDLPPARVPVAGTLAGKPRGSPDHTEQKEAPKDKENTIVPKWSGGVAGGTLRFHRSSYSFKNRERTAQGILELSAGRFIAPPSRRDKPKKTRIQTQVINEGLASCFAGFGRGAFFLGKSNEFSFVVYIPGGCIRRSAPPSAEPFSVSAEVSFRWTLPDRE